MVIILRIGGSVLASPLDSEVIGKYSKLLKELAGNEHKVVAIIGGGSLARKFITIGRKLGLNETSQDLLAIEISRILALIFSLSIDSENSSIPTTINNALEDLKVENDGTVRHTEGNIIQFIYGEDGIDPSRSTQGKSVDIDRVIYDIQKEG